MMIALLLSAALSACQLLGPEETVVEKSFPEALDAPVISFESISDTSRAPGIYNLEAIVIAKSKCPGEDACQFPNSITLSSEILPRYDYDDLVSNRVLSLWVQEPHQFQRWRTYLFSIEIEEESWSDGQTIRRLYLVGYSTP